MSWSEDPPRVLPTGFIDLILTQVVSYGERFTAEKMGAKLSQSPLAVD